jgi:NADH dehydrogenase (ubiquinone) 1 alpha subcomplex subunit 13
MALSGAQELPPQGGFPRIQFKRNIPVRGPPGWALLLGVTGLVGVGLYYSRLGYVYRWELERERLQAQLHLEPFLQAEKDRFYIRALNSSNTLESRVMKNVDDWNMHSSVYHNSELHHVPEYILPTKIVGDNVVLATTQQPVYPALHNMRNNPFRPFI